MTKRIPRIRIWILPKILLIRQACHHQGRLLLPTLIPTMLSKLNLPLRWIWAPISYCLNWGKSKPLCDYFYVKKDYLILVHPNSLFFVTFKFDLVWGLFFTSKPFLPALVYFDKLFKHITKEIAITKGRIQKHTLQTCTNRLQILNLLEGLGFIKRFNVSL